MGRLTQRYCQFGKGPCMSGCQIEQTVGDSEHAASASFIERRWTAIVVLSEPRFIVGYKNDWRPADTPPYEDTPLYQDTRALDARLYEEMPLHDDVRASTAGLCADTRASPAKVQGAEARKEARHGVGPSACTAAPF